MKFPEFMQQERFNKDVDRIKASVFSKLKRHVYAEQHTTKSWSSRIIHELTLVSDQSTILSIMEIRRTVYNLSATYHNQRLQKRLSWFVRQARYQPSSGPDQQKPQDNSTAANTFEEVISQEAVQALNSTTAFESLTRANDVAATEPCTSTTGHVTAAMRDTKPDNWNTPPETEPSTNASHEPYPSVQQFYPVKGLFKGLLSPSLHANTYSSRN